MRVRLNHKRLIELIGQSKLSQNHWAMRLGLSRGHWSGIVNGKHPYPSQKTRMILLETFGVPFDELFTYESHAGVDAAFQGDLADRYHLEREIGQGGMGTVYLARDVRLARYVALKVVSAEAVSGIGVDQFLKEIRLTALLQHPHILPVHDAGEAAGSPYYVMPYIEDGSLRRRLDLDGAIGLDRVIRIVQGIADALRHAHDRQLLHCDVKPENVLLTGDHAFVADFGIARAIHAEGAEWGRRSDLDSSAGTPAYVSPEQASGEMRLDARSDVYSLACMTFEMLTGQAPFEGQTTMETVAKRFVDHPHLRRLAPHISSDVAVVVETAMDIVPAQRPASSTDFSDALNRATRATVDSPWNRLLARVATHVSKARRLLPTTPHSLTTTMDTLRHDIGFAFRTLRRSPLAALVMVVTLALGIGVNSAVFTVVNGVLLRPLPYADAERLVFAWSLVPSGASLDTTTVNPSDFLDWRTQNTSFTDMAAFNIWLPTVSNTSGSERVSAGVVTPNFFDVVGVPPALGPGFSDSHGESGNQRVVVLSNGFWQRWFGGDSTVLNQTLSVGGEAYDIVGVMPNGYRHVDPSRDFGNAAFWAPISISEEATNRTSLYLRSVARLKDDVAIAQAQTELQGIARQLETAFPITNANRSATVVSLREHHFTSVRPALIMILAAAALVLLIVCANIANLVLARSQNRRREFAIRTSLGAGKIRLARQLIVEQTVLTVPGAIIGLVLVGFASRGFSDVQESFISRIAIIGIDWRVVLFSVSLALTVAIAFGLVAIAELRRTEFRALLAEESAGSGSSRATHRFRTALVISQIGLAAALLIGAGLLTRSFVNLVRVPTGFDIDSILTFETIAPRWRYDNAAEAVPFFSQLTTNLRSIPGVENVGMISDLPFTSENRFRRFNRVNDPFPAEDAPSVEYHHIDRGYLETAGIAVKTGRAFTEADHGDAPPVVIVNESAASLLWPGANRIVGQHLVIGRSPDGTHATVVGVVSDVLDDGFNAQSEPRIYLPYLQAPSFRMSYLVKSHVNPATLATTVRQMIRTLDPETTVGGVVTLEDLVAESVAGEKLALQLASWFSIFAVALAAIGIYGLMAFMVGARKRELGIRTALGAESSDVMTLVLGQSVRFTVAGLLLGLGLGAATTRLLSSLLFGVTALDPVTFFGAPLVLGGVAFIASYLPARRASKIQPMAALRAD